MTLIDMKAQAYDALNRAEFSQAQLNEINRAIAQMPPDEDPEGLKWMKSRAYDALARMQAAQAELAELNNMIRNYTDPAAETVSTDEAGQAPAETQEG